MTGVFSEAKRRVLRALAGAPSVRGWYLGGTALALRQSISEDFDLFRPEGFDPLALARSVAGDLRGFSIASTAEDTAPHARRRARLVPAVPVPQNLPI